MFATGWAAPRRRFGAPRITKDGVTVAKEIELDDKFENMGAQMVREVASKTSDQAGDGTTTATILAHAIVREGAKGVAAGMNPMDLKRGVDLAVNAIVEDLKKNSKKVTSNDEIAQVGTISANGDREIGDFLAKAMQKVGNEFSDPELSVIKVAQSLSISPRYLQRLLELSGTSFAAHVTELRLKHAFMLLTAEDLRCRIRKIALQAGFSDISHFNRLFRSRFGDTPKGVRAHSPHSLRAALVKAKPAG